MRIVIDMPFAPDAGPAHPASRHARALAQALARSRGGHELVLAVNGACPAAVAALRSEFAGLLPAAAIRLWFPPPMGAGAGWPPEAVRCLHGTFLASLRPDWVYLPAAAAELAGTDGAAALLPQLRTMVALRDVAGCRACPAACYGHVLAPLTLDEAADVSGIPAERLLAARCGDAEAPACDADARTLLAQLEHWLAAEEAPLAATVPPPALRPRLAYVSPLPPMRSGISDYSAELLPELAAYYDIDVVVAQEEVSDPWVRAHCNVRSAEWFARNAHAYARVLYHFGNSHFHSHMFELLEKAPGVVVLHDFFLGDLQYARGQQCGDPQAWLRALYEAHGYGALFERFHEEDSAALVARYPANFEAIRQAHGVIVHSRHARELAQRWYAAGSADDWAVIPLARATPAPRARAQARAALGLPPEAFVVCSFGLLGPTKLNLRLLEAWLQSRLAADTRCVLVFVGENHPGEYGARLTASMRGSEARIRITGWADTDTFRDYLAAADLAVQLRTQSRGETSAAVLDCLNYGLPTIANANGSMAELPQDALWLLPDAFSDGELVEALETLWQDGARRQALAARAREHIAAHHTPRACARQYAVAIEAFQQHAASCVHALVERVAALDGLPDGREATLALAESIARTLPARAPQRQLLVDVSATCRNDLKTGIQRVVRALVAELIAQPPPGHRIEPVYCTDQGGRWHYRYARGWTVRMLGGHAGGLADDPVAFAAGDTLLVADYTAGLVPQAERAGVFRELNCLGAACHFILYDLLPIRMPQVFPPGPSGFADWLASMSRVADGVVCISQAVATDYAAWLREQEPAQPRAPTVDWVHLGADVENSMPSRGLPPEAGRLCEQLAAAPTFLMVGTIEPRKGYLQVLEAFTQLWQEGADINLAIVGREGWRGLPDQQRRNIPHTVAQLRGHAERNRRLFWLDDASDEYLENIYAASTCLIAASEGEGFGLPLIEAAQRRLPLLARDIPVFREVAGEHAHYFSGATPHDLVVAVRQWLQLYRTGRHPSPEAMPWLTWRQCAQQLAGKILPPGVPHGS